VPLTGPTDVDQREPIVGRDFIGMFFRVVVDEHDNGVGGSTLVRAPHRRRSTQPVGPGLSGQFSSEFRWHVYSTKVAYCALDESRIMSHP